MDESSCSRLDTVLRLRDAFRESEKDARADISANDPDNLRRNGKVDLQPVYTDAKGIFGESYFLNVNDHIGYKLFIKGYFDATPSITSFCIRSALDKPGVWVDIGANIGSTFLPQAKAGIECLAIEASSNTGADLLRNMSLNQPIDVDTRICAVTDSLSARQNSGYTTLHIPSGNIGAASLFPDWNPSHPTISQRISKAKLTTIDNILLDYMDKDISCIKLDVEGAESSALEGATNTLRHRRPFVMLEWRPDLFSRFTTAEQILDKFPGDYAFRSLHSQIHNASEDEVRCTVLSRDFSPRNIYENVICYDSRNVAHLRLISNMDNSISLVIKK